MNTYRNLIKFPFYIIMQILFIAALPFVILAIPFWVDDSEYIFRQHMTKDAKEYVSHLKDYITTPWVMFYEI